ncbi:MAG: hypothetical protein A2868_03245 [Candidatus Levybacteria bacterium RIFCSPHIGHO2_01_FULL_40_15b]|nr:MAG: hypothetical protein A2868_03245 [Candidatus Levybacteria bacterium RIFCSPHIGHO2_01_FULL_40_15b]
MKQKLFQIYTKYKKQILPLALILLSLFIAFRVILPQFSLISETNSIIENKKQELETLNNSIRVLETTSDDAVSEDLAISTNALPTSKDVTKIFGALSSAASASNTELNEFSLKIGGVFGKEVSPADASAIGVPQVSVVAKVSSSDTSNLIQFGQKLDQTLPLSEIKQIDAVGNLGTFEIKFYYKPIDLNIVSKKDKVTPLSQADRNLLNQLAEWNQ